MKRAIKSDREVQSLFEHSKEALHISTALWWYILIQILFSLLLSLSSLTKLSGISAAIYFVITMVVSFIYSGFSAAVMVFIDNHKTDSSQTASTVWQTTLALAKRLLIPLIFLGLGLFFVTLVIGILFMILNSQMKMGFPSPYPAQVIIRILQVIFTPFFATFPIYFALKKMPFIMSVSKSIRYALNHPLFSIALGIFATVQSVLLFFIASLVSKEIFSFVTIGIGACYWLYHSVFTYEYWSKNE